MGVADGWNGGGRATAATPAVTAPELFATLPPATTRRHATGAVGRSLRSLTANIRESTSAARRDDPRPFHSPLAYGGPSLLQRQVRPDPAPAAALRSRRWRSPSTPTA